MINERILDNCWILLVTDHPWRIHHYHVIVLSFKRAQGVFWESKDSEKKKKTHLLLLILSVKKKGFPLQLSIQEYYQSQLSITIVANETKANYNVLLWLPYLGKFVMFSWGHSFWKVVQGRAALKTSIFRPHFSSKDPPFHALFPLQRPHLNFSKKSCISRPIFADFD